MRFVSSLALWATVLIEVAIIGLGLVAWSLGFPEDARRLFLLAMMLGCGFCLGRRSR